MEILQSSVKKVAMEIMCREKNMSKKTQSNKDCQPNKDQER